MCRILQQSPPPPQPASPGGSKASTRSPGVVAHWTTWKSPSRMERVELILKMNQMKELAATGIWVRSKILCRFPFSVRVTHCTIWYHLYNFKNVKNTHGGVLLLVRNTPPSVIFKFLKFHKWYQMAQNITYEIDFWVNIQKETLSF